MRLKTVPVICQDRDITDLTEDLKTLYFKLDPQTQKGDTVPKNVAFNWPTEKGNNCHVHAFLLSEFMQILKDILSK